ncbi:hypothetical protein, unlikely [Trypanosoma brucei brucei TREU927]|uniref:Uncharacterized protein n=1 Tax=Trypanosoma brucei brucei (strain 927/4 GUTat10.1) TaxID=185431 RepID=Q38F70_TRYB2|nr:hypothetical protein, unlikely [Trypanosoma brucei brucei TREU927]EAN76550.1 hypothetical protein, unlikely [Trypanosoma brucei brucei TREU927]
MMSTPVRPGKFDLTAFPYHHFARFPVHLPVPTVMGENECTQDDCQ